MLELVTSPPSTRSGIQPYATRFYRTSPIAWSTSKATRCTTLRHGHVPQCAEQPAEFVTEKITILESRFNQGGVVVHRLPYRGTYLHRGAGTTQHGADPTAATGPVWPFCTGARYDKCVTASLRRGGGSIIDAKVNINTYKIGCSTILIAYKSEAIPSFAPSHQSRRQNRSTFYSTTSSSLEGTKDISAVDPSFTNSKSKSSLDQVASTDAVGTTSAWLSSGYGSGTGIGGASWWVTPTTHTAHTHR